MGREGANGRNRPRKKKQGADKEFVFESGGIASSDRGMFSPGAVGDLYFDNQEDLEFEIVPSKELLK